MQDIEAILEFTEELFYAKTENYFSDLQRIIILSTWRALLFVKEH